MNMFEISESRGGVGARRRAEKRVVNHTGSTFKILIGNLVMEDSETHDSELQSQISKLKDLSFSWKISNLEIRDLELKRKISNLEILRFKNV